MKRLVNYTYILAISSLMCPATTRAQAPPPVNVAAATLPADRSIPETVKAITEHLQSADPAVITQGVDEIHELSKANNQKYGNVFRSFWLKRLLDLQRYDDVADLSMPAILGMPSDTQFVEQVQSMRVQALLGEGKSVDALAAAKQLFNVCTLKGTADAIRAVCQCLNAVHPHDRNVLSEYRREQISGAAPSSSPLMAKSLALASVEIDAEPYEPAIREVTSGDFRALTGQGNLMLLAGKAKDAWEVFELAYTLAPDRELPAATENLARCIKAQDGTIGRANAWVLSIRPQTQLAAFHLDVVNVPTTQASHRE